MPSAALNIRRTYKTLIARTEYAFPHDQRDTPQYKAAATISDPLNSIVSALTPPASAPYVCLRILRWKTALGGYAAIRDLVQLTSGTSIATD